MAVKPSACKYSRTIEYSFPARIWKCYIWIVQILSPKIISTLKSRLSSIRINQKPDLSKVGKKTFAGSWICSGFESPEGNIPHICSFQVAETFNWSKSWREESAEFRDDKAEIICRCSNSRFQQFPTSKWQIGGLCSVGCSSDQKIDFFRWHGLKDISYKLVDLLQETSLVSKNRETSREKNHKIFELFCMIELVQEEPRDQSKETPCRNRERN